MTDLNHSGVLGMKWGRRKNPANTAKRGFRNDGKQMRLDDQRYRLNRYKGTIKAMYEVSKNIPRNFKTGSVSKKDIQKGRRAADGILEIAGEIAIGLALGTLIAKGLK